MDSIEVAKNIDDCFAMGLRCGNTPSYDDLSIDDNLVIYIPTELDWDIVIEHAFQLGAKWQGCDGHDKKNEWYHHKENTVIIIRSKSMSYGGMHCHSGTILHCKGLSPTLFAEFVY